MRNEPGAEDFSITGSAMASNMTSMSATERAKMPAWSSDQARGNTFFKLILCCAGTSDAIPQKAAGLPTDPTVCEPIAAAHMREATAAADPLLEPPGVCSMFQGFLVGPGSRFAKTVVTVFPRMIAPACLSLVTAHASYSGTKSLKSTDPIVVRSPIV